ncbi:hypothetical protein ACFQHO_43755 [Actinomadura yumaensis]|uniref:hypothetical protein n=1 Tax=Actinomadura yumaensis TaxID=111807 RepID=UPI003618352A
MSDGRVPTSTCGGGPTRRARSRHRSVQRFIRRNDASSTGVRTLGSRARARGTRPRGARRSSATVTLTPAGIGKNGSRRARSTLRISMSCSAARWPHRFRTVRIVPPVPFACMSRTRTRRRSPGGAGERPART